MRTGALAAMTALITVLGVPAIAGDAPSETSGCKLTQLASIALEISPTTGAILVPVTLDGTEAWMQLMTSAALSVVSEEAAEALNLKRVRVDSSRIKINGSELNRKVVLDSFMVGNVLYRNAELAVSPMKQSLPIEMGRPVAGTLGINVFDKLDFELHLAEKKLSLYSQDHCPGNVVYWTKDYTEVPFTKDPLGTIIFPMELDGRYIEATLATNYALSTLDSNITKKVFGFDENSPEVTRETNHSGRDEARFKAMALSAPGLNVSNTRIRLDKGPKDCGQTLRMTQKVKAAGYSKCFGVTPLRLGMNVLNNLRIYVSMKEKVVYISRADAT